MRGEKTGDAMGAMYSIILYGNDRAKMEAARDTKVDAEAIHQQNGLNPSVCVRKAAGAFVGQLGKLRPIVNRPDAALAPDGGGSQPPRRLPACPTSRQRFHFYLVHPVSENRFLTRAPLIGAATVRQRLPRNTQAHLRNGLRSSPAHVRIDDATVFQKSGSVIGWLRATRGKS